MKRITRVILGAVVGVSLFANTGAWGATIYLRADKVPGGKVLPGGKVVEMWGFALENQNFNAGTAARSPGPILDLPPGASGNQLIIVLTNNLTVPVSVVIPNQNGYVRGASEGVKFTDGQGRQRAQSFVKETLPGQTGTYQWNNVTPGTYLYYSGSHASLQVQMGLHGALTRRASGNEAYAGNQHRFDTESLLLFSEIDTTVHDAVAIGNYRDSRVSDWTPKDGSAPIINSTIHSVPNYFLINGSPFTPGSAPVFVGYAGQRNLLRLLNASVNSHVPVINGWSQRVFAEDGRVYPYPRELTAPELPALKTMDAFLTPTVGGIYALYDRGLGLVNEAASPGGMLTYLAVGQIGTSQGAITIPLAGNATPYPSAINITGMGGSVGKVTVTLTGFYHARPQHVDVYLVSPSGNRVLIMSDVGGNNAIAQATPVTLTFDDQAAANLTANAIVSGTYKPTDLDSGGDNDVFTDLPAGSEYLALAGFAGENPNGAWRLYVRDDQNNSAGGIQGWSVSIIPQ